MDMKEAYMEKKQLLEYINKVFELEAAIYTQNEIIKKIDNELYELNHVQYREKESYYSYEEKREVDSSMGFDIVCAMIIGIIASIPMGIPFGFLIYLFTDANHPFILGDIATFIVMAVVWLPRKISEENWKKEQNDKIRYENMKNRKMVEEANEKVKRHNNGVVNYNENLHKEVIAKNGIYIPYKEKLIEIRDETKRILEKFYDKSIIYPKYRDIVAVSSFYDYLSSGVCDSLEGHEGCYNKFDLEVRLDTVISKLDDVLDNLDQIKKNQHTLYLEMVECNERLSGLSQSLRELSTNVTGSVEEIKMQTAKAISTQQQTNAVLEYYGQEISRNVDAIKWLDMSGFIAGDNRW